MGTTTRAADRHLRAMEETPVKDDEWITTREAADLIGCTYRAFRSYVNRYPQLKAAKKDGTVTGQRALWHRETIAAFRPTGRGNRTNHHEGPMSAWPRRKQPTGDTE